MDEEAKPVQQLRPEVPAPVAAIVHRLLAKRPGDRYQTPAELAAALAPFAAVEAGGLALAPPDGAYDDHAPTPTDDGGFPPDVEFHLTSSEERSALNSTLPPSFSPTPVSIKRLPSMPTPEQRRRQRLALAVAVGVVGALTGLLAVLAWLMR
jgi:hypothetical protein